MTRPRRIIPGQVVAISRETRDGRYFLRPDFFIKETLGYFMGYAQRRHKVVIHGAMTTLNRLDYLLTDPFGLRSNFTRDLHSFSARTRSVDLGLDTPMWSHHKPAHCVCADHEAELEQLIELWTAPVRAGLVRRAKDWPGFKILPSDWGQTIVFERPNIEEFFTTDTNLAATYELEITVPPCLSEFDLDEAIDLAEIKLREAEDAIYEAQKAARDDQDGAQDEEQVDSPLKATTEEHPPSDESDEDASHFLGTKPLLRLNPFDGPSHEEFSKRRRPCTNRFAAHDSSTRQLLHQRYKEFQEDYRWALDELKGGFHPTFPAGTVARGLIDQLPVHPPPPDEPYLHPAPPGKWPLIWHDRPKNNLYTPRPDEVGDD